MLRRRDSRGIELCGKEIGYKLGELWSLSVCQSSKFPSLMTFAIIQERTQPFNSKY